MELPTRRLNKQPASPKYKTNEPLTYYCFSPRIPLAYINIHNILE